MAKLVKSNEKQLSENYILYWSQQINSIHGRVKNKGGNKLRTYCKFKCDFALEPYLSHVENVEERAALTKLRLSSHPLNIEALRGRVQNPDERLCEMCHFKSIEDEFHFIGECPKYQLLRNKFLVPITGQFQNVNALSRDSTAIWLLSNEDKTACKSMAKYIYEGFKLRRQSVTNNSDK